jgi:hypothetical protein
MQDIIAVSGFGGELPVLSSKHINELELISQDLSTQQIRIS